MGHFNGKVGQGACAVSRDRVVGGHPNPHIWNQRPQFASSLYNFHGAKTTIKGVYTGAPHCKAVFSRIFFRSKVGQKWRFFWELRAL